MKFQSRIFINIFTFFFLPNTVLFLFLLILYQGDVERAVSLSMATKSTVGGTAIVYDQDSRHIVSSTLPFSIEAEVGRNFGNTRKEDMVFSARAGDNYYRFTCQGSPVSHCDAIRVDSLSIIHRLGFTNIFLILCGINLIIIFITSTFVSKTLNAPINRLVGWINSGSKQKLKYQSNLAEIDFLASKLEQAIESERALLESQKLADIGKVATAVAHDIRSPLSSLKAAAKMLKGHVAGNNEALEVVNLLQLSGNRLENIANDLLARHQDKSSFGAVLFSIHEVLDELIGEFQVSPLGKGVEFKKHYNSGALYVSGDKTGMTRAIGNIIKNALEAMGNNPEGKKRELMVSTAIGGVNSVGGMDHSDSIILKITDAGPGISAEKIPLILQGGHTEGKSDGHGIGTRVVREMVEAYKGQINIESQLGVGTTFIIALPQSAPVYGGESEMTVAVPYSGVGSICVIDDEPSMKEQWRLTLKGLGVEVESYACWDEYASAQSSHSATTFIIDYHFNNSKVDGLEIVRRLKERGFSNLVLATAEYWKPDIKESARELNITLCPKPLPCVILSDGEGYNNSDSSVVALPQNDSFSILVLDDDPVVRQTWKLQCKMWGIPTLHAYASMEECVKSDVDLQKVDLAFVDKNIDGSAWATDALIAHLKTNGVGKVWIASGEAIKDLQSDSTCAAADGIVEGKIPLEIEPYTKGIDYERYSS